MNGEMKCEMCEREMSEMGKMMNKERTMNEEKMKKEMKVMGKMKE